MLNTIHTVEFCILFGWLSSLACLFQEKFYPDVVLQAGKFSGIYRSFQVDKTQY